MSHLNQTQVCSVHVCLYHVSSANECSEFIVYSYNYQVYLDLLFFCVTLADVSCLNASGSVFCCYVGLCYLFFCCKNYGALVLNSVKTRSTQALNVTLCKHYKQAEHVDNWHFLTLCRNLEDTCLSAAGSLGLLSKRISVIILLARRIKCSFSRKTNTARKLKYT